MQRILDDEIRCAHIDRHHGIEKLGLGIPDGAAIGDPGGIDHRINPAKCLVCGGHDFARVIHISEIGFHKNNFDAFLFQFGFDSRAILFIAPGNHNAFATPVGEEMSNGFAKTLC
jgi:hypothetical protein